MESTPSRDTGDTILDITLFTENLADSVGYWKAEVFPFLLCTSMAVFALQKIITKNYTRMKYIILWTYHYLDWYLQMYTMYLFMVMKFKVQFASILSNLLVIWNTVAFPRGGVHLLWSRSNWNLEVMIFVEGGKLEYPEKNPSTRVENQQQTQPTYDAGSRNRTRDTLLSPRRMYRVSIDF